MTDSLTPEPFGNADPASGISDEQAPDRAALPPSGVGHQPDRGGPSPPTTSLRVLMAEDDERLAELTARYLEQNGVSVTVVADGNEAIRMASTLAFDLILLDVMLPGKNGIAVCQELRTRLDLPIIMVTARSEEADRVMGLELGADDYVAKPFSSRELLARIRAHVRRSSGRAGPTTRPLRAGRVQLDPSRLIAKVDNRPLELTGFEFSLLKVFVERPGRVLSRDQLLGLVHSEEDAAFDRSIDGHISRLRQKLGDDSRRPSIVKTVRGIGYMLAE